MQLNEKIKFIRERAGYSQENFANELNATQGFISSLEKERKNPSYEMLQKIDKFAKRHKIKINLL